MKREIFQTVSLSPPTPFHITNFFWAFKNVHSHSIPTCSNHAVVVRLNWKTSKRFQIPLFSHLRREPPPFFDVNVNLYPGYDNLIFFLCVPKTASGKHFEPNGSVFISWIIMSYCFWCLVRCWKVFKLFGYLQFSFEYFWTRRVLFNCFNMLWTHWNYFEPLPDVVLISKILELGGKVPMHMHIDFPTSFKLYF